MTKGKHSRRKKGGRKSTFRTVLFYSSLVLIVLVALSAFWLKTMWDEMYEVVQNNNNSSPTSEEPEYEPDRERFPDVMNVLILGLDSRDEVKRSDTVMLLSLNRSTGEINIFSIPRDMRVEIPGRGLDKINHAYAFGEVALSRRAVEDFLEIDIDYYVTTDFEGFVNVVDLLGGIELEVEQRMRYYGIDVTIELDPGLQHLDGEKALQYVRYRSDGQGDLGRVKRQQAFLKALLQEMLAFRNIMAFPRLLPQVAENVKTDMALTRAIDLASKIKNTDIEEINTFTLPGRVSTIQGISYVVPDEEEIQELLDEYIRANT